MRALRRHLAWVLCAWLVCHVTVLMAAPVAMCASASPTMAEECTCVHEPGAMCPMHHRSATSKAPCSCRATVDPLATVAAALLGPAAMLPPVVDTALPIRSSVFVAPAVSVPLDAPDRLDAPPPRA